MDLLGLFSKRNKIRSTGEAEMLRKVFKDDYDVYCKVGNSEDLKRFSELEAYVNSPAFRNHRKQVEQLSYKGSEYYTAEKRYKKLLGLPSLRAYYQIKESQELQGYLKIRETDVYRKFAELRLLVKSSGFDKRLRPDEFIAYRKLIEDPKIKALMKFEANRKFKLYLEVKDTELPQEFEKLALYIRSDEFKKNRGYLLNKKRFLTTDDYKLQCEYEALKSRPDFIKYFALRDNADFRGMCDWVLVFADEFNTGKLDENKWITRYYAGERFLNDTYGVGNDVQLFTKENVSFGESSICLNFKKEQIIGKYWDGALGIREKKYNYTSAMFSSASSFRQCYGKFEAKIKLTHSPVRQSFVMKGNSDIPHVEVMESGVDGVKMGTICNCRGSINCCIQGLKGIKLANDYYIFTFEWTRDKMVWKINDYVVKEVHENVPNVPMFAAFVLGTNTEPSDRSLPARMEVDWVRFYKWNDTK